MNWQVSLLPRCQPIATIIQAYRANVNRSVSRSEIRKSKERASVPLRRGSGHIAKVIDKQLLEAFAQRIQREHAELIAVLDSQSTTKKDHEVAISAAKNAICFYLNQIKHFNRGLLPTRDFRTIRTRMAVKQPEHPIQITRG